MLVTRAVSVLGGEGEPRRALYGAVSGFGRVVATEFPALRVQMVDLAPGAPAAEELMAELTTADAQEEVTWRGGHRFVPRVIPAVSFPRAEGTSETAAESDTSPSEPPTPYAMRVSRQGDLGSVQARAVEGRPAGVGEVRIDVRYAALNFRDVLKAMGNYPVQDARLLALGDECVGRVREVGSGVTDLVPGDRVVLSGIGLLRSEVTLPASSICRVPEGVGLAAAAAFPVAHLTADYALRDVARIEPGETILVHSGAGGVGLAALRIAQSMGARVFATAGTPAKRELLRHLGAEHVMDSRLLTFADEIREYTSGRGVDVVLNSLAGQAMERSLSVLAPSGRFVELGRRDFFENTRIGLWPLRENCSYHAVDLGALFGRPEEVARRVARLLDEHGSSELPYPMRVVSVAGLPQELRRMSRGGHVGKIVLDLSDPGPVRRPRRPLTPRTDGSYLVTGAFGGVGRALARKLVKRGARHLVLVGRRGAHDEAGRDLLRELGDQGVEVLEALVDISDEEQVADFLHRVDATMPPLRGVFHLAMVLDDVTVLQLTAERLERVFRPKVHGAWNLHRLCRDRPLDLFVLFGSAAASFGNFGQAGYAAANAALDALSASRRASGLPATTVAWGMIGEVGCIAETPEIGESLERIGVQPLSNDDLWEALDAAVDDGMPNRIVLRSDWRRLARTLRASQRLPGLFAPLFEGASDETDVVASELAQALLAAEDPATRSRLTLGFVRGNVAAVLGTSPSMVHPERSLAEMGLDSLMGVELIDRISTQLGMSLPLTTLSADQSVATMAVRLESLIFSNSDGSGSGDPVGSSGRTLEPAPRTVHLAGDSGAPRIWCPHPAGGDLGIYAELAEALGEHCRVDGIESRLLAGGTEEFSTLDVMGAAYADIVVREQSSSEPVRLVGFSMGGLLALETARALEERGRTVDFVALLEYEPTPVAEDERVPRTARFLSVLLEHFRNRGLLGKNDQVVEFQPELLELTRAMVSGGDDGLSLFLEWLGEREVLSGASLPAPVEQLLRVMAAHLQLFAEPRSPHDLKAPTPIWLAETGLFVQAIDRATPGAGSAPGRPTVLPTDHYSIMTTPNVEIVADQLLALVRDGLTVPDPPLAVGEPRPHSV